MNTIKQILLWVRHHLMATLIIVAITTPVIMSILVDSGPTMTTPPVRQVDLASLKKDTARHASKSYVLNTLKAPSTAKFNLSPAVTADEKVPDLFTIESYVDSENSFGAMLRSYWTLKTVYVGKNTSDDIEDWSNYKVVEFEFDGKRIK